MGGEAAGDHLVEQLLLCQQVALDHHDERQTNEEVAQEQTEEVVPVAQGFLGNSDRLPFRIMSP